MRWPEVGGRRARTRGSLAPQRTKVVVSPTRFSGMSQSVPRPRRPAAPKRRPSDDEARPGPLARATRGVRTATVMAGDIVGGAAKALATPTGALGAAVEA